MTLTLYYDQVFGFQVEKEAGNKQETREKKGKKEKHNSFRNVWQ